MATCLCSVFFINKNCVIWQYTRLYLNLQCHFGPVPKNAFDLVSGASLFKYVYGSLMGHELILPCTQWLDQYIKFFISELGVPKHECRWKNLLRYDWYIEIKQSDKELYYDVRSFIICLKQSVKRYTDFIYIFTHIIP